MNHHARPPVPLPATPEYVLAVIQDQYRQFWHFKTDAGPEARLTFDTTIAELQDFYELRLRELGRTLDAEWNLGRPDDAWRAVLEPESDRTVRDLCEFIAHDATMPGIRPSRLLGVTCAPAGAFLAICSLLHEAGADVDRVTPSTPIAEFARRYFDVFLGPISRLAPGALPVVTVKTPWFHLCVWLLITGVFLLIFGAACSPTALAAGASLTVLSFIGTNIAILHEKPRGAAFGDIRTFRDLAGVVASGSQFVIGHG